MSKKRKSGTMGRSAEHPSSSVSLTVDSNIYPEKQFQAIVDGHRKHGRKVTSHRVSSGASWVKLTVRLLRNHTLVSLPLV